MQTTKRKVRRPGGRSSLSKKDISAKAIEKIKADLKNVAKAPMPHDLSPMLATRINEPFDDPNWLFEIKWDGYRSLCYIQNGKVELKSRSKLSLNKTYPSIVEDLQALSFNAVLDGEICVLAKDGKSDFEALQNWGRREEGELVYYVFDILWMGGFNLVNLPLSQRKDILKKLLPAKGRIKYSDSIDENGKEFFELAKDTELEGIVGKKKDSIYHPGQRSGEWLKMPTATRQEFVVGGWTESSSGRAFKSLLFGYYENGKLINVGHAGGGYKEKEMKGMLEKLKELETSKNPFADEVESETKIHWIKPKLVAEIKYASFTSAGKIRKPAIFLGFRSDKNPKEVVKEIDFPKENDARVQSNASRENKASIKTSPDSNWPELEKRKITSRSVHAFDKKKVELTNIEQVLWPGFTKAHLLMYYHSVYPFIIPHIEHRPLSLHIKPYGPAAAGLYIKDMEGRAPHWAEIFIDKRKHAKKGKRDVIDYLVCNDEATLQYLINLGAIDVNPWTSTTASPDQPGYIVIDLDPSDDDFKKAIETANAAKDFFDQYQLKALSKTSGKTGIHIYLPCIGFKFPEARTIAENISEAIHSMIPSITTTNVSIGARGDKLYIDPNQNDYADTVAAPYSVRPFKWLQVSTPLEWKEINAGLDPSAFTTETVLARLKKKGDLFKEVLDRRNAAQNRNILKTFL